MKALVRDGGASSGGGGGATPNGPAYSVQAQSSPTGSFVGTAALTFGAGGAGVLQIGAGATAGQINLWNGFWTLTIIPSSVQTESFDWIWPTGSSGSAGSLLQDTDGSGTMGWTTAADFAAIVIPIIQTDAGFLAAVAAAVGSAFDPAGAAAAAAAAAQAASDPVGSAGAAQAASDPAGSAASLIVAYNLAVIASTFASGLSGTIPISASLGGGVVLANGITQVFTEAL